ncbi:outer membrane protein, partial [Bradyrhizobium elkanii]
RATKNIFGGTLGAGIEYAFLPGWSAKVEYDYFDFGRQDVKLPVSVVENTAIGDEPSNTENIRSETSDLAAGES